MNTETLSLRLEKALHFAKIYGVKILSAIAIFWIGLKLIGYIDRLIDTALKKAKIDESLRKFLESLSSAFLKIALVVVTLGVFGVEPNSFLAIFGAAGLAVGLALQGSLANFASGVMILFFKPYKIGDFVTINGNKGTVKQIAIFDTTLITPDHKTVIIPNSLITSNNIINGSRQGNTRVDVSVGISYDADIKKAKEVLTKIITDHPLALSHNGSGVFVSELADSSVNLIVRAYTKPPHYRTVFFDLTEQTKNFPDTWEVFLMMCIIVSLLYAAVQLLILALWEYIFRECWRMSDHWREYLSSQQVQLPA